VPEQDRTKIATKGRSATLLSDVGAAGVLGLLLGVLIGLSGSPVVSVIVTGLVTLLAGLFGFSDKLSPNLTASIARRIVAFGLAAVITTPVAIYVRTHELLAPSVKSQRDALSEIGIKDSKEQAEMLRFLRFGILPSGTSALPKDSPSAAIVNSRQGVLFAQSPTFCSALLQLSSSPNDILALLDAGSKELKDIAAILRRLPDEQRTPALAASRIYLCGVQ
jgi:hypothetical protein